MATSVQMASAIVDIPAEWSLVGGRHARPRCTRVAASTGDREPIRHNSTKSQQHRPGPAVELEDATCKPPGRHGRASCATHIVSEPTDAALPGMGQVAPMSATEVRASTSNTHEQHQSGDALTSFQLPTFAVCVGTTAAMLSALPLQIHEEQLIAYTTFVPIGTGISAIPNAGTGLVAMNSIPRYTWVGLYPGKATTRLNGKRAAHTMGSTRSGLYIIADKAIKTGVHMINEATTPYVANVWYVKLANGYVLYFTGASVASQEELLTCYSRSYGKRGYPVPTHCSDPRCIGAKHRLHSAMLKEWRKPLLANAPPGLSRAFLEAAGLLPPP